MPRNPVLRNDPQVIKKQKLRTVTMVAIGAPARPCPTGEARLRMRPKRQRRGPIVRHGKTLRVVRDLPPNGAPHRAGKIYALVAALTLPQAAGSADRPKSQVAAITMTESVVPEEIQYPAAAPIEERIVLTPTNPRQARKARCHAVCWGDPSDKRTTAALIKPSS